MDTACHVFLDTGALQLAYERQTQLLECVHGQSITDLLNSGDLEDAFSQWAHLVEEAISQVWQHQYGHPMPASMRGRCKTSPVQFAPTTPSLRSARHGDFEPDNTQMHIAKQMPNLSPLHANLPSRMILTTSVGSRMIRTRQSLGYRSLHRVGRRSCVRAVRPLAFAWTSLLSA